MHHRPYRIFLLRLAKHTFHSEMDKSMLSALTSYTSWVAVQCANPLRIVLQARYNHFMVRSHAHVPILIFHFFSPLYDRWRDYAFRDFWKFEFRFSLAPQFIQALPNRFGRVLWMNPLEGCQKVCWSEFSGWSVRSTDTAWAGRMCWDRSQSRTIYTFLKVSANVPISLWTSSSCGPREEILR